ncbi:hypothetical protein Agabi119p4_4075 [Agaricus bisporus var. burnettii]|uniref:GST N-terminal domain-containing protein n=1 Tax=Agaricus bisporus var. burnettii TaxID=192524 RepID=A0A8H7KH09_AGABI|nr:hypothetical protein Agabi119p4_4075 [Agaricus bisporus var. burnettii]
MPENTKQDKGRAYHTKCTGAALSTVARQDKDEDITLFGSCFCPFVQRVWIAFEYLGVPYKACCLSDCTTTNCSPGRCIFVSTVSLINFDLKFLFISDIHPGTHLRDADEVNPYKKPQELLEVSPKGLVPGLRFNNYNPPRALNESTVILEYLEDLASGTTRRSLLPPTTNPYARALVKLQSDHVNRNLVPAFYRFLQAQDTEVQITAGKELHQAIETLVGLLERAEREIIGGGGISGDGERQALSKGLGLWIEGGDLGWTDVMVAPWLYRARLVLKHYRGFELPQGDKFTAWLDRLFTHLAVVATCSTDDLYLDSYERYAFNRPNTSQVANAINSGRGLP